MSNSTRENNSPNSIQEFMNFCSSLRAKHGYLCLLEHLLPFAMAIILGNISLTIVSQGWSVWHTALAHISSALIIAPLVIGVSSFCRKMEKKDFALTQQKYVNANLKKDFLSLWHANLKILGSPTNQKIHTLVDSWDKGDLPDIKELCQTIELIKEKQNSSWKNALKKMENYLSRVDTKNKYAKWL